MGSRERLTLLLDKVTTRVGSDVMEKSNSPSSAKVGETNTNENSNERERNTNEKARIGTNLMRESYFCGMLKALLC